MDEYESPESNRILAEAVDRVRAIASENVFASQEQRREALRNICELIETSFDEYRREIGKVQTAELEELRRQAAALKGG